MSSGVDCQVWHGPVRMPDGCYGDPLDPTVLSGLSVTWGRSTTMDQPGTPTCTFTIEDAPAGQTFAGQLHTGAPIRVTATGQDWPDPDQPAFGNGDFEADAVAWTTSNATATRTSAHVAAGHDLRVAPVDPARRVSVNLAPAPFSTPGQDPDAWDHLPATSIGQRWQISLSVWAVPGVELQVRPLLYAGPYPDTATTSSDVVAVSGTGAWQSVELDLLADVAGAWVGVQVSAYPTGPAWDAMPPALTWDGVDPTIAWVDMAGFLLDDVVVLAPAAGTARQVLVFAGRVTDLEASAGIDGALVTVACADFTADLQNRVIGDEPWTAEPLTTRAHRILDLAGLPIAIDIAAAFAGKILTYRDVDAQGAFGLLTELAQSVDGVLWPAVHRTTGAYFDLEDVTDRAPMLELQLVDGVIVVVPASLANVLDVSACDVLLDPVRWVQSVADVLTRASVTWLEQLVDDQGKPANAEHTQTLVDAALEAQLGTRGASVSTQLTQAADADDVAGRLLSRAHAADWRAQGLTIDDAANDRADADYTATVLDFLDGTARIGAPILLDDLPGTWTPIEGRVPVYLEGGTYTYDAGAWVLDLTVSNATGQGQSAAWDELDPTWTWEQFDPSISWNDLRGVAA